MLNLNHYDIKVERLLQFESCPGDFMWYILQSCSKHSIVQNKFTICSFDVTFNSVFFMLICSKKRRLHACSLHENRSLWRGKKNRNFYKNWNTAKLDNLNHNQRLSTNFANCFSFLNLNIPTKYVFTNLVKVS